jgi:MFS family permease
LNVVRVLLRLYRSAFSGVPREVWALSTVALVNRAGTMVLPFLTLYLTQRLDLTPARAGQIVGCYGLGSVAGSYLGGWLSDRIGARRVQLLSLTASGLGFLMLLYLHDFSSWALGVFCVSTVAEAFRPAMMVAVADASPPSVRPRAFAAVRLAVNLGMSIGPAVGGLLAARHYRWLFIGDAATCWAAAVVLLVAVRDRSSIPTDRRSTAFRTTGSPWRDPPFLGFLALTMMFGVVFLQIFTTMPIYFKQHYGFAEDTIGLLLALNAILIVALEMILLRALENRDRVSVAGAGALLACAGMALLPLGSVLSMAVLSVVIWTFGEMLALPMCNAIAADRAGTNPMGSYMGAYTLAFSVSFVLAPVLGTIVYQHVGPDQLWYGVGVTGVLLAAGFGLLSRSFRRPGAQARQ